MASIRIPYTAIDQDMTVNVDSSLYAKRVDEASSTVTYVGAAAPGSAASSPVWQIQRLTFTGPDITIEWANGNKDFNNIWNNRLSLSYS